MRIKTWRCSLTKRGKIAHAGRGFSTRGTKGLTPHRGSSNFRYFSILLIFESVNFNLVGTLMTATYQQKEGPRETGTDLGLCRSVALILDEVSIKDPSLRLDIPSKEAENLQKL